MVEFEKALYGPDSKMVLIFLVTKVFQKGTMFKWVDFELRLKYLIRRALYLGYRIRVAVDWFVRQYI